MEKVTRKRHPNRISLTELVYGIYITKKTLLLQYISKEKGYDYLILLIALKKLVL